ncbi:hypothetical protein MRS44_001181 [Fusarium solani]|uniref:Uncharacterized protein n=1 Tax=Fusarium solani TaxID=169388 RepID=A0A9P9L5C9_FUSSL|nr:uncharacterized protein B0J15DRAFT_479879 [Fusarium solani]KAH7274471.1 hypothetical protein B0J15DRAFT_479879 [Fusarium solani]KAJ3471082.1 hypothetical protein MRS44_001181 [Fusarium solani]
MASSSSSAEDTEILVHITAPSRTADDVVYRQLARAYLAFQPQTRTALPSTESWVNAQARVTQQEQPRARAVPSPSEGMAAASFGQSFEIGSQDLSFEGALDNRSSPCIRYTAPAEKGVPMSSQEAGSGSLKSWYAPPSQISDSYPMPDAGLLSVSPSRVLQRYIGRAGSPQASSTSPSPTTWKRLPLPSDSDKVDVPSSLPIPSQDESLPLEQPRYLKRNTIIPRTPQVPKAAEAPGASDNTENALLEDLGPDITHISSSIVSSRSPVASPRAGSEPPPAKRPRVNHPQHGDLVRSSSDTVPTLLARGSQVEQLSNSLEIRPPSPPVGVDDVDPSDLISAKLAKLARDLSSRYRPDPKRAVDPFERGYWLLDCTDWSAEIRFETWGFLSNYLRSGLAGWGTWCRRDKSHNWIRLYCWGHVAKHTYLLLYLASGRQLKATGASWYGADGQLAIEVPPYEKQA